METHRLLAGLNKNQLKAVTAVGGPIIALAGAGSGKTQVLTKRIARRVIQGETDPQRVLALTFTNKAAHELGQRIKTLGLRDEIPSGTFHSIALNQLKQRWDEKKVPHPKLVDNRNEIISKMLPKNLKAMTLEVSTEISWTKARMIDPAHYPKMAQASRRKTNLTSEQLVQFFYKYDQFKKQNRSIDFDDVLYLAIKDLLEDQTYAAAIRWRHRHFYVDEFQDINPLQYELLNQWRDGRPDLFAVGDPNQAIYGWNGADPSLLNELADREPDSQVIRLDVNYRSTSEILDSAEAMLPTSQLHLKPLEAARGHGFAPKIRSYKNDVTEAESIAQEILDRHKNGSSWSDHCVLVRTLNQTKVFAQVFEQFGVPFQKWNNAKTSRPKIMTIIDQNSSLATGVPGLIKRINQKVNASEAVDKSIDSQAVPELVLTVLEYAKQFCEDTIDGSVEDFKYWIIRENLKSAAEESVDLTTFHASKGLEWPVVYLAGVEHGLVPISYATTKDQLDEEDRLLYVAMTRAEDLLYLSWAKHRTFGSNISTRQPSSKLKQLKPKLVILEKTQRRPFDLAESVQKTKKTIEADAQVSNYELKLNDWLKRKAMVANVSASAILNTEQMKKLIETQPKSLVDLEETAGLRRSKISKFGKELIEIASNSC